MQYSLFLIPILSAIVAQGLKLSLDGIKGNFRLKEMMTEYGGMPSSHTAFVVSLVTMLWLDGGLETTSFAVALILAIIVIRDAIGFRRALGKQSNALRIMLADLKKRTDLTNIPKLPQEIGHNPLEVLVGGLVGLSVSLLANLYIG